MIRAHKVHHRKWDCKCFTVVCVLEQSSTETIPKQVYVEVLNPAWPSFGFSYILSGCTLIIHYNFT